MGTSLQIPLLLLGASAAWPSAHHEPLARQEVRWEEDLAAAFERARAEARPLLLALYTADEARSEDALRELQRDREVERALAACVAVQAVVGEVSTAAARRFGGHPPEVHRALELEARDLVAANDVGALATPQHVWLDPDGGVLVSAPYELAPEEFLWLDWRARVLLGEAEAAPPKEGRAPRRHLERQVFVPADGDRYGRGLKEEEREEALDLLRRRGRSGGRAGGSPADWTGAGIEAFVRLARTDHDEAQDHVRQELGNFFLRRAGRGTQLLESALETVAYHAPEPGVEVMLTFLDDPEVSLRLRAAAALEQMGFAVGWGEVRKRLPKEEEPVVRRALLRAAGVVGRGETGARRLLVREAERAELAEDRAAALVGLGHCGDPDGAAEALVAGLADEERVVSLAAAAGMALTRDARFRPELERLQTARAEDAALVGAALAVLDGAPCARLRPLLEEATDDDLARPRLFFTARPPAGVNGTRMSAGGGR